jgi:hypothetical protein
MRLRQMAARNIATPARRCNLKQGRYVIAHGHRASASASTLLHIVH